MKDKKNDDKKGLEEENNNKKFIVNIKEKKSKFILISVTILIVIIIILSLGNGKRTIKTHIKSTLTKLVEKSDLETATIMYNVIAKKCNDEEKCDLNSNNINDFKYVASCQGSVIASIDFKHVSIDVDDKNKKVIIKIPDATIKENIYTGIPKLLNGENLPMDILPEAKKLCKKTIKEKSDKDKKLIQAAKDQAIVVLKEFYDQLIKGYDASYTVEVKWGDYDEKNT